MRACGSTGVTSSSPAAWSLPACLRSWRARLTGPPSPSGRLSASRSKRRSRRSGTRSPRLTEEGCPVSKRSVGRRTVKLRSTRPTTVVATFAGGRISYSPSAVRFVASEVTQSGSQTTGVQTPCRMRTITARCRRAHRAVGGGTFGFFRSARNEISFRNARLVATRSSCPRESSMVLAIMPGLRGRPGGALRSNPHEPPVPVSDGVRDGRGGDHSRRSRDGARRRARELAADVHP